MSPKDRLDEKLDNKLDEALEEGFPASDPPSPFGDTSDEREDAGDEPDEDEVR